MSTVRCLVSGVVVTVLAAGCATVSEGDRVPSAANAPLGGPRIEEPGPDAGSRAWGIDLFSGLRTRDHR